MAIRIHKLFIILTISVMFLTSCNIPLIQQSQGSSGVNADDQTKTMVTLTMASMSGSGAQETPQEPCLEGGDQNSINARLKWGSSKVMLCQRAVFELTGPVIINSIRQKIFTEGFPEDDQRAVLRIVSENLTVAIIMRDYDDVVISNVIIDGNRPNLGYKEGEALVAAGGDAKGQVIRSVKITEPRSWSALHLMEPCTEALIENNEIGPAGMSDRTWADGISLACTNSIVRNNTIVDATDGAIVVFAATGSFIENNIIRAETRTLLGGIHMVESRLLNGNYTGTIVQNNIIEAAGAVIRIAVPMGPRVWLCLDPGETIPTAYGGTVINNILRGDKMQYGFAADGVSDWTVLDNTDESTHIGTPSVDCRGQVASYPSGFQYYQPRAKGTFQSEFKDAFLELALIAIVSPLPGQD
ncbi:MAG: right-handed parallel beta-helix repeat-containing protein [Anaerolineaceae bacterium]|nr:right-handed parallel beta-helix repeat-containing protein [Anaerolineaceae bacterium]